MRTSLKLIIAFEKNKWGTTQGDIFWCVYYCNLFMCYFQFSYYNSLYMRHKYLNLSNKQSNYLELLCKQHTNRLTACELLISGKYSKNGK